MLERVPTDDIERREALESAWAVVVTDEPPAHVERSLAKASDPSSLRDRLGSVGRHCAEAGILLALFSSPEVFDGCSPVPYGESSPVSPASAAGRAARMLEHEMLATVPRALVLRCGDMFGPGVEGPASTSWENDDPTGGDVISPTYLPDLANATIDLIIDGERGTWHLANSGLVSRHDFQRAAWSLANALPTGLEILNDCEGKMRALVSERGWILPDWESALQHFVDHHGEQLRRGLSSEEGAEAEASS